MEDRLAKYQEIAKSRGGVLLSVSYLGSKIKHLWRCSQGHEWWARPNSIGCGYWCPECGGTKRKDIGWLHELASQKGGKCLSTKYINNRTKYEWECGKCGHRWEATASDVHQNHWCPKCGGSERKDINWLHELAAQNNGKCLSPEYINSQTKYEWECGVCGHRWWAKSNDVQQGQWCPQCAGHLRKDIDYLYKLATQNNGKCLSTKYINMRTKYKWECSKEHQWFARANDVYRGKWCPHCANQHSRQELRIYEFIKSIRPDALSGQRKLLLNPNFELDIYIPSLKKAIEFDGKFWHSTPDAQERDLRKNQECEAKGIKLLRIPEQDFLDNPQQVFDTIKDFLQN